MPRAYDFIARHIGFITGAAVSSFIWQVLILVKGV